MAAFVALAAAAAAYVEILPTRQPFVGSQLPAASHWTRFPGSTAWQVVPAEGGAVVSGNGGPFFSPAGNEELWYPIKLTGDAENSTASSDGAMRLVARADSIVALATIRAIHRVSCVLDRSDSACTTRATIAVSLGELQATAATVSAVWLASMQGLFRHCDGAQTAARLLVDGVAAVAASGRGLVAAGNSERLWLLDEESGAVVRWEWVSDVPSGQGGVVGDAIRTLAWGAPVPYGGSDGLQSDGGSSSLSCLFVGTQSCINVRDASGAFLRVDADDGLPVSNAREISIASRCTPRLRCSALTSSSYIFGRR